MRNQINSFIAILWVAIFALWFIASLTSKQTTQARERGLSRIAVWIVGVAWILLFNRGFQDTFLAVRFAPETDSTSYVGLAVTVAGLALSVWARFYIGRNWSGFIELKKDHQLIRTGPYAIVRHPIYSGFMLATLGTAIAFAEVRGLISVVLILGAWGYKARLEEKVLIEHFGTQYESYMHDVKGLIPFVW